MMQFMKPVRRLIHCWLVKVRRSCIEQCVIHQAVSGMIVRLSIGERAQSLDSRNKEYCFRKEAG